MIKKTITYTNYDGQEYIEEQYFKVRKRMKHFVLCKIDRLCPVCDNQLTMIRSRHRSDYT